MIEYVLKSSKFEGEITFQYDDDGVLKAFLNDAVLTPAQRDYFIKNLPKSIVELPALKGNSDTATITERKLIVSFEMFWEKFNNKVDKMEAMKVWAKMKPEEQFEAHNYIERYNSDLARSGVAKKYPKTYLRNMPWVK